MFRRNAKNESMVETLKKRSGGAIDAVVTLISQLRSINETIDSEKAVNAEKIMNLESDQVSLDNLKASNEKIINNFEGLLK